MSYVDKNLMSGETVVYRAKLHWILFLSTFVYLLIAVLFFINGANLAAAGALALIVGIVLGISALITYKTSEFAVTNKRVIAKVGFMRRSSMELLLPKIEGVQVRQSILGRILDYGSIQIIGTGGTRDPFRRISSPLEFRKQAQEQISAVISMPVTNPVQAAPTPESR